MWDFDETLHDSIHELHRLSLQSMLVIDQERDLVVLDAERHALASASLDLGRIAAHQSVHQT